MDIRLRQPPALRLALTMLVAAAYLAAGSGVLPAPVRMAAWLGVAPGDRSERYPCEGHGCGCASAAECWSNCCCHSEHERLVWAIRHGVMPPEGVRGVRISDERWIAAANAVKVGSAHCGLCVAGIQDRLRAGIATQGDGLEGDGDGGSCCDSREASKKPEMGLTMSALGCKNLSPYMLVWVPPSWGTGAASILMPPVRPQVLMALESRVPAFRVLEVPEPPPRVQG